MLFIGTEPTFAIGLLVARLVGEDLLGKTRPANVFDSLSTHTLVMAWMVFAIAIVLHDRAHLAAADGGDPAGLTWEFGVTPGAPSALAREPE